MLRLHRKQRSALLIAKPDQPNEIWVVTKAYDRLCTVAPILI